MNKNDFKKKDFDKFSKDENVVIKKVRFENRNDNNVLKQELINQIYQFSEKRVIFVADNEFLENFRFFRGFWQFLHVFMHFSQKFCKNSMFFGKKRGTFLKKFS